MGISEAFKKMVGIEELDEDEIVTEEELAAAKEQLIKDTRSMDKMDAYTPSFRKAEAPRTNSVSGGGNMDKRYSLAGTSNLKLIVIEPKNFEECKTLVDNLKAKKPIIVNLEKLETETAKKIFDFLSGAIYALGGDVHKITNNIFIFAPANVGITESRDNRQQSVRSDDNNQWR